MNNEHQKPLAAKGPGKFNTVDIMLEPVDHLRIDRFNDEEWRVHLAHLENADFTGNPRSGANMFEVNIYDPNELEPETARNWDRKNLLSFEFHSVAVVYASDGIMEFSGYLSYVSAYSRDAYRQLAEGVEAQFIPEMSDGLHVNSMPPWGAEFDGYLGWKATIRISL